MKRHAMALTALVSVLTGVSCTQGAPANADTQASTAAAVVVPNEDVAATITQLERDWVAAIVRKDAPTIDRLLAEDFTGTSPTAHLYTKKIALDDLARGTYVVEAMDLDEVSVNSYGDFAVAFASQQEKSKYGGKDVGGHYHYTNVWVKKDGRWQVVTSHGSRYDSAH